MQTDVIRSLSAARIDRTDSAEGVEKLRIEKSTALIKILFRLVGRQ